MDASVKPIASEAGVTETLTFVGMTGAVLMPGMVMPFVIGRPIIADSLQDAARTERHVVMVLQREPFVDTPSLVDLHAVGTEARLLRYFTDRDGSHNAVVQGVGRVRIEAIVDGAPHPTLVVERITEPDVHNAEIDARMHQVRECSLAMLALIDQAPAELSAQIHSIDAAGTLADFVMGLLDTSFEEKQEVLEAVDLLQRLDLVIARLTYRYQVLKLSREIGLQTRQAMEGRNREFMLREQLKAIQKELGEADDSAPDFDDLKRKLEECGMPDEVAAQTRRELRRLERMPDGAAEAGMVRTYLDWMTELPWRLEAEQPVDIGGARAILNEDHYDLDKIKRRILEYLAVRKLNPEGHGPILCFVGPPGVGKTSLGQSIARAIGRKFVRVSLGGVHDEAEIRGHRRTYVGAMPGNIIQSLKRAGERNAVVMLDEIDKLGGGGFQGDPASALLEVLDPEQNGTFRDAYLGVPFDLSRVLFIATANVLDTIPGPLRDRMEVVRLSGYTAEEKVVIARLHLIPRQLKRNGLPAASVELNDAALNLLIDGYTREAGVRNLEREIGAVFRNVAVRVAEGAVISQPADAAAGAVPHTDINPDDVSAVLGAPRFDADMAQHGATPGVATGLAWTPVGGDILFIEASRVPGAGKMILTGQLGDVMKESVQAAMSLLKTRAMLMGIDAALFANNDV
ncbi:MAG TPA: endopeptidase La, partial [Rhodospirillaceae bacterium]|nr:endopeptidase La [Rhodospirillaceae bacterium]